MELIKAFHKKALSTPGRTVVTVAIVSLLTSLGLPPAMIEVLITLLSSTV